MAKKESIEKTIYNIRRKTRKKYTAEDKIRIVLDELGFIPFSDTGAQVLFTFCSELYERLAFTITTNLKFADWGQAPVSPPVGSLPGQALPGTSPSHSIPGTGFLGGFFEWR